MEHKKLLLQLKAIQRLILEGRTAQANLDLISLIRRLEAENDKP